MSCRSHVNVLACGIFGTVSGSSAATCATGIPRALADWVAAIEPSRYALLAILGLVYLVLGTALDGVSMIVLTTSVVIPT